MKLWEEAPITEWLGISFYTFGLYCAAGAVFAVAAVLILSGAMKLKKGSGILLSFLSVLSGLLGSRLVFCVLNTFVSGDSSAVPWLRVSAGGWSMAGMVFGVLFAAWACSRITGENCGMLQDIVCCAVPLAIAAERFGERVFEGFDVSRALQADRFPAHTFLAVRDSYYGDVSFLATYLLASAAAVVLFLILNICLVSPKRRDGDLRILFLLLFGSMSILLESLRYDHFLEYSFVRFQQVLAAVLLAWGVILACVRNRGSDKGLSLAAYLSLPAAIGICVGIEFALDRTGISHLLLYAAMILALAVPVSLGIALLGKNVKGQKAA